MPIPAKTPLITLMRLEAKHVAALNTILNRAVADLDKQIAKMGDANPITVMQAKAQREAMASMMGRTFDNLEDVTRVGMVEAAQAASGVVSRYENELLKLVMDKSSMTNLAKSEAQRAAAGMEAALKRMQGTSYMPLSKRVYNTRKLADGWVDDLVNKALASGWSRQKLAKELRQSINPATPGGVSYAANRTARTEINNAFHASSAERYMNSVIVEEVDWHLSSSHPEGDICDTLQDESPYPKKEVPKKPHPNCYCYITPALPTEDEFLDNLLSGKYDPEDAPWTREQEAALKVDPPVDPFAGKSKAELSQIADKATEDYFAFARNWSGSQEAMWEDPVYIALNAHRMAARKALLYAPDDGSKVARKVATKAAIPQDKINKLPKLSRKPQRLQDAYDRGAANPNGRGWSSNSTRDYQINCTRVSYATEMRMRGFDVTAGPAGETANKTDAWIQANWVDRKTGKARSLKKAADPEKLMADMLKNAPDGARYFVVAPWKAGGAHIWNAEKVNGKIVFHEGQVRAPGAGTESYTKERLERMDFEKYRGTKNAVRWMRVDDLEPTDTAITRGWVEVNGKVVKNPK